MKRFTNACVLGDLSVVQQIYFANPMMQNLSARNEEAFRFACAGGHLSVAQWLFSIKPTIDVSALNEQAFRYACWNCQLTTAQWLFSVKPTINVSADNDQAFRMGDLGIKDWLVFIKPFLYTKSPRRIRNAEHVRWQTRKYALYLRSEKIAYKKKRIAINVFCKVSEDVSRYIVQMYL